MLAVLTVNQTVCMPRMQHYTYMLSGVIDKLERRRKLVTYILVHMLCEKRQFYMVGEFRVESAVL